jgi:hypothetical protein
MPATERPSASDRRTLHDDKAGALKMVDQALCHDHAMISSALWTRLRPSSRSAGSVTLPYDEREVVVQASEQPVYKTHEIGVPGATGFRRKADQEQPSRSDWTCAANRAVVRVRVCDEALLPRWSLGHCGVVLVTADAVEARGEHHGKAYRYPTDRLVGGGSA